ncbi:hypothetical protein G7Y89_g10253 [Cudoniella acicularis]|uniref:N-acetyltransferase domain-containing protein n=1 Tax=Cudoniella acicularis TaxID=354080 RepID=A0A8H4VZ85_9HELO|nr:hypothetical protein G7Y89_g10253 [Cudoniella acicularis]
MGSQNPNFILSPATTADIPHIIPVYLSAFSTDHFSQYTFPRDLITPSEWVRWLTSRYTNRFAQPELRHFKVTETATGNVCAFIRWRFPHQFSEEEKLKKKEEKEEMERLKAEGKDDKWPVGANLEACDGKFGGLDKIQERFCTDDDYAVHQGYQGKGLGRMLLEYGLKLADAEGKRAYIQATRAGYPVYAKLGFKEVDCLEVDLSKWGGKEPGVNWAMLREPQKTIETPFQ